VPTANRSTLPAMPDLRKLVLDELARRKWSRYRLVKELAGKVPASTVYEYLAEKSDMTGEHLGVVFDVLHIESKPPKK
jgi:hypothetical protein